MACTTPFPSPGKGALQAKGFPRAPKDGASAIQSSGTVATDSAEEREEQRRAQQVPGQTGGREPQWQRRPLRPRPPGEREGERWGPAQGEGSAVILAGVTVPLLRPGLRERDRPGWKLKEERGRAGSHLLCLKRRSGSGGGTKPGCGRIPSTLVSQRRRTALASLLRLSAWSPPREMRWILENFLTSGDRLKRR